MLKHKSAALFIYLIKNKIKRLCMKKEGISKNIRLLIQIVFALAALYMLYGLSLAVDSIDLNIFI
jgi:hypothetical protein